LGRKKHRTGPLKPIRQKKGKPSRVLKQIHPGSWNQKRGVISENGTSNTQSTECNQKKGKKKEWDGYQLDLGHGKQPKGRKKQKGTESHPLKWKVWTCRDETTVQRGDETV